MIERQIREIADLLERLRKADVGGVVTTYTPTYDGAVSGVTTYSVQQGSYVREGNTVAVTGTIVWTNATGTGDARISLPITASATTNQNFSGFVRTVNITFANGSVQAQIAANTAYMIMFSPATNAAGTTVQMETAGNLIFTAVYFVD